MEFILSYEKEWMSIRRHFEVSDTALRLFHPRAIVHSTSGVISLQRLGYYSMSHQWVQLCLYQKVFPDPTLSSAGNLMLFTFCILGKVISYLSYFIKSAYSRNGYQKCFQYHYLNVLRFCWLACDIDYDFDSQYGYPAVYSGILSSE